MKKTVTKVFKKVVENSMKINANSTTSYFCYQPKVPDELKKYSKHGK